MTLKSLTYSEFEELPQRWTLQQMEFGPVNLLVGKNATGKSRTLNVVGGLCRILGGSQTTVFVSGTYKAEIELIDGSYVYELASKDNIIIRERLQVNDALVLERDETGRGRVWFETQGDFLDFQVEPFAYALPSKRDTLQHPFAANLSEWARGVSHYEFGTDFGRSQLMAGDAAALIAGTGMPFAESGHALPGYVAAFQRHGAQFDEAVVNDMKQLGYSLSTIEAGPLQVPHQYLNLAHQPIGLQAFDTDLGFAVPQVQMSQGMYRALALVIQLNRAAFSGERTLVLVDDIGEGLDYERASLLIDLAINHTKQNGIQLIMTSNDRFVMNKVPLNYWAVLEREKTTVSAHTARTSPEVFEDFKFLGLSNFDFFTSGKYH